jgi:uncharacterized lipoprotein YmbA
MKIRLPLSQAFLFATILLLAGCASVPSSRFYTLTPLDQQEIKPISPEAALPVSIRIAPVEIPDYLDRPQIVTRDGKNELQLAELDRWGGSLKENIAAVLAENLTLLLGSDRIFTYPRMRAEKTDYLLALRILRLACTPGDRVLMKAQWTIYAGQYVTGTTHMATFTEPLSDGRYETLVAAISHALAQVSREIAQGIPARNNIQKP